MIYSFSNAQAKFEKESRISHKNVPIKAKTFVFKLAPSKKVRWYKEQSLDGESIEAKTSYNNKKYSIEFDTNGKLQDIEINTKWNSINKNTITAIKKNIEFEFSKFKIKKIQTQYSGNKTDLLSYFKSGQRNNITIKYEIVLKGKTKKGKQLFEMLFSETGMLEKSNIIIFRNTDNIEF